MNPIPLPGQLAIGVLALSFAVAFLLLWDALRLIWKLCGKDGG